jgi:3-hydroxybutyryl-CoA dehydrogenase
MDILIVGTQDQAEECRQKFGGAHTVRTHSRTEASKFQAGDIVFDFTVATSSGHSVYAEVPAVALFLDTSMVKLSDQVQHIGEPHCPVFGFCGFRTLINRDILEVTVPEKKDYEKLKTVCQQLGTDFRIVSDQAGMVTPRVICMIINEAYYTLEEGTATREDIDLAMKLGTNYPYGPFEWGERMGLGNVVRVLDAARRESDDERYEVCPLLRDSAR